MLLSYMNLPSDSGFVDKVFVVVVKTIISLLEKVIHVVSCD